MLLMWNLGCILQEILEDPSEIQGKNSKCVVLSLAVWMYLRSVTRLLGTKVASAWMWKWVWWGAWFWWAGKGLCWVAEESAVMGAKAAQHSLPQRALYPENLQAPQIENRWSAGGMRWVALRCFSLQLWVWLCFAFVQEPDRKASCNWGFCPIRHASIPSELHGADSAASIQSPHSSSARVCRRIWRGTSFAAR